MSSSLRARYRIERESPHYLLIRDIGAVDGHTTITNDAEAVVADLVACGALQQDQKIIYIDSENCCGELQVNNGRFSGFAPIEAWVSTGDGPRRKVEVKSITMQPKSGDLDVVEPDLLYRMARHIRQTDELNPFTWASKGIELLNELRNLDPDKYDRLVK